MAILQQLSDDLWNGVTSTLQKEHHPFAALNTIEPVSTSVRFYKNFSNITLLNTGGNAVLIDTGSFHPVANRRSFEKIREETGDRIDTAIYTHGHVDHAYGLPPFLEEAKDDSNGEGDFLSTSAETAGEAVRVSPEPMTQPRSHHAVSGFRQGCQKANELLARHCVQLRFYPSTLRSERV